MKKQWLRSFFVFLFSATLLVQAAGCYGSFNLTKKLYSWNGSLGNKFVNSAVMWVLFIIPAYEVCGAADLLVLNFIEFWTGKNPVAMNQNEKETQYVTNDGSLYRIVATQNRFDITAMNDGGENHSASLFFNTEDNSWYISGGNDLSLKIAEVDTKNPDQLRLIRPDNSSFVVNLNQTPPVQ